MSFQILYETLQHDFVKEVMKVFNADQVVRTIFNEGIFD
jgi:hypothetical protein